MISREIGLGIQSDKRPGEYAAIAAAAEHYGIDVLSVYGDLMYQPPLGPLLEMAAATERVRLGPSCLNPYSMHPYEIAGQIAALDLASRGRAYLGLARGTWLRAVGIDQQRPLRHLSETAIVVRALLGGDAEGFDGEVFSLRPGTRLRYELHRRRVPLLIGTWGPQTIELAGRVADEVKIGGSANPKIVPYVRSHLGAAGEDVGIVIGAVSVIDDDADAARARARTEVATYLAVVAELDPTYQVPPEVLEAVRAGVNAGDPEQAGRAIPDDVLDHFAFSGTPEKVAAQVGALFSAGATRVELGTPHGVTPMYGIELIGRRVLPAVAR